METKQALRQKIWRLLEDEKAARFPGARGRIPNFEGAEICARHLSELPMWKRARVIKVNPDSPQRAVRQRALEEGKILYMAVPRLSTLRPFIELNPKNLDVPPYQASSIKGAFQYGRPVSLEAVKRIDLIVCGSVVVNRNGGRTGKGEGYSDLEYALLTEERKVGPETPIITTVHALQVRNEEIPMAEQDIPLDVIVTPQGPIPVKSRYRKPNGIYWHLLPSEKLETIPVLKLKKEGEIRRK